MAFASCATPAIPSPRKRAAPRASFHQTVVARLNDYRLGLLMELTGEAEPFVRFARLAINEAEALAGATPFPHLLLPVLAGEKIESVRQWVCRQQQVGRGYPAGLPLPGPAAAVPDSRMG